MNQFGEVEQTSEAVQSCDSKPVEPEEKFWIEIEMVFEKHGQPVVGEEYCITLPDGVEVRGSLDENGQARVDFIEDPGNCDVTFPGLDKDAWKSD